MTARDGAAQRELLPEALATCRRCPRLVAHRERVAVEKRRSYRDETYWGRPVPGFGDAGARILLLGLAPGAHGSNRTGRQFTGDASGDFLYPALHRAGLASRPVSERRGDGLELLGLWITAAARCVPPGNKPTRGELAACRDWLGYDVAHLPNLRVVLALGAVAHDAWLEHLKARGLALVKSHHAFEHAAVHRFEGKPAALGRDGAPRPGDEGVDAPLLVDSYHVSFQNTNTGRLTEAMFDAVVARALELARS